VNQKVKTSWLPLNLEEIIAHISPFPCCSPSHQPLFSVIALVKAADSFPAILSYDCPLGPFAIRPNTKLPAIMAPSHSLSRGSYDCNSGYQWYTCDTGGQSWYGCCSINPCASVTFCPVQNQDPKLAESSSITMPTSTSPVAYPSATYPTLVDDSGPANNNGSLAASDGDYGSATAKSSTYTDSASQAGVAIAATVGTLVFIGAIAVFIYLYRFLRRAREAREREAREKDRRNKRERRRNKVYIKPATISPSSSGWSSEEGRTSRSRSRSRGRAWSTAPNTGVGRACYDGGFDYPHPAGVDYRYEAYEASYGVYCGGSQFPSPPSPVQFPALRPSSPRLDRRRYGLCFSLDSPAVPPLSPGTDIELPGIPPITPVVETDPHSYRRYSADTISPLSDDTVPLEGWFVGIPARRGEAEESGYPETRGKGLGDRVDTVYRPAGYQGGPVTPVWDSDGVLEEIYLEDRARSGKCQG
jgi:hypothetical protein